MNGNFLDSKQIGNYSLKYLVTKNMDYKVVIINNLVIYGA